MSKDIILTFRLCVVVTVLYNVRQNCTTHLTETQKCDTLKL